MPLCYVVFHFVFNKTPCLAFVSTRIFILYFLLQKAAFYVCLYTNLHPLPEYFFSLSCLSLEGASFVCHHKNMYFVSFFFFLFVKQNSVFVFTKLCIYFPLRNSVSYVCLYKKSESYGCLKQNRCFQPLYSRKEPLHSISSHTETLHLKKKNSYFYCVSTFE